MEKKIHLVFSLIMSFFMIFIMSFVVTFVHTGFSDALITKWLNGFWVAWLVGFPLMFVFGPIFKKTITKFIKK